MFLQNAENLSADGLCAMYLFLVKCSICCPGKGIKGFGRKRDPGAQALRLRGRTPDPGRGQPRRGPAFHVQAPRQVRGQHRGAKHRPHEGRGPPGAVLEDNRPPRLRAAWAARPGRLRGCHDHRQSSRWHPPGRTDKLHALRALRDPEQDARRQELRRSQGLPRQALGDLHLRRERLLQQRRRGLPLAPLPHVERPFLEEEAQGPRERASHLALRRHPRALLQRELPEEPRLVLLLRPQASPGPEPIQALDVKRRDALSWSVELEGLRQLLSMPESYKYPSTIKRQLEPAHHELVQAGFLSRADFEERGRGATKANLVRYRVSQKFVRERSRPTPELSDGERFATDALVAKGVWAQTAKELVVKHGVGHCLHYVEALPHQEGVKNPAGWLRTHIENAWPVRVPEEPPILPTSEPNGAAIDVPRLAPRDPEEDSAGTRSPASEDSADSADVSEASRPLSEEVERRRAAGEFDAAIEAFETLPYEEYAKFVGHAVRHLDGNRYYV